MRLLRVILPPVDPKDRWDYVRTQGTIVVTPSGEHIDGITKLVLIADTNDVWRAEAHFMIAPPDVSCLATMDCRVFVPPLWRRLWNWLRYGYRIRLPESV